MVWIVTSDNLSVLKPVYPDGQLFFIHSILSPKDKECKRGVVFMRSASCCVMFSVTSPYSLSLWVPSLSNSMYFLESP